MQISKYELYPIYEHAEGGYFYAGERLVHTVKVKHGKGKKQLKKLYNRFVEEHGEKYAWLGVDSCGWRTKYIGEGETFYLEGANSIGSHEHGYTPYC